MRSGENKKGNSREQKKKKNSHMSPPSPNFPLPNSKERRGGEKEEQGRRQPKKKNKECRNDGGNLSIFL